MIVIYNLLKTVFCVFMVFCPRHHSLPGCLKTRNGDAYVSVYEAGKRTYGKCVVGKIVVCNVRVLRTSVCLLLGSKSVSVQT